MIQNKKLLNNQINLMKKKKIELPKVNNTNRPNNLLLKIKVLVKSK